MFGFNVLRWQIANLTLICNEGLPLKCLGAIIKTITLIFRKFLSGSTFRGVYYRFWTCWLSFPIYTGFFLLLLFFKIDSAIRPPTEFPSLGPGFNNSYAISALGGEAPRAGPRPRLATGGNAACSGPGPRCPQGARGPGSGGRKPGCGGDDAARQARRLGTGSRQNDADFKPIFKDFSSCLASITGDSNAFRGVYIYKYWENKSEIGTGFLYQTSRPAPVFSFLVRTVNSH